MEKGMTYEEFIAYAKEHYNEGGDCVVECWDKLAFDTSVKMFGPMTKKAADATFQLYNQNFY